MVLHNNKWDRKAKVKYLKKHGIAKPVEDKKPREKWSADRDAEAKGDSDGNHSHSDGESEQSEIDASDRDYDYTKNNLPSLHQGDRHDGIYLGKDPSSCSNTTQPLQELDFEIEAPYQDPSELVAQHIASFKMAPQPRKGNVRVAPNAQEFEELEGDIAANKLKSDIKRRFGKSKFSLKEEEDDFWEAVGPAAASTSKTPSKAQGPATVDPAKQAWLDDLIGS